jgi:sugar phosphate isomerase/epimerase
MRQQKYKVPKFGLLTNPSINMINEIKEIHRLNFYYVEVGIEGPEGNPYIIVDNMNEITKLLLKFDDKPATAHWMDLGSDFERVRQAWISEAIQETKLAKGLGIYLINFHSSAKGMFFGEKRKMILDNWIKSLREIISHSQRLGVQIMLENVPKSSSGIHKLDEYKYIIDNVQGLNVHLDIPHAFTSGGMQAIIDYIRAFSKKIVHIHWHDNNGVYEWLRN